MKIIFALAGVAFVMVTLLFLLLSLAYAFNLLTDGDGRTAGGEFTILIVFAITVGFAILSATLSFLCFRAWQQRRDNELTKLTIFTK